MDSIAITYSLLDPIMTVMRPFAAFATALVAGILENFTGKSYREARDAVPDRTCLVDGCCDGVDCDPEVHAAHHSITEKLVAGMRYAFNELMGDLLKWFLLGILLAGVITACVPESWISGVFGSGILGYLAVLAMSLPMYVCASMSTPIAAALILKGMSPGTALVFLLAGPATNVATITMVLGILGRRTLTVYLVSIVLCTLGLAFLTDFVYAALGIHAVAEIGQASKEFMPEWLQIGAAVLLAILMLRVALQKLSNANWPIRPLKHSPENVHAGCSCEHTDSTGAG